MAWLYAVLCALTAAAVVAEPCNMQQANHGCTVLDAHAHCENVDLIPSIHGLPTCTTKITFLLTNANKTNVTTADFRDINFSRFPQLNELSIYGAKDKFVYNTIHIDSISAVESLKTVRILRLQVPQTYANISDKKPELYQHLKSLEVLDLTRATDLGIKFAGNLVGKQPRMKVLILKNVQRFDTNSFDAHLDLAHFICGSNVRHLDLSYNDIIFINISSVCWNDKLRYLNLKHNMISHFFPAKYFVFYILPMLAGLEELYIYIGSEYQEGLWDDDAYEVASDDDDDEHDTVSGLTSPLLKHSLMGAFAGTYGYWLKDVLQHCGHITDLDAVRCMAEGYEDIAILLKCLDPRIARNCESKEDSIRQTVCFFEQACKYDDCHPNIPIPAPPKLKIISGNGFGKFSRVKSKILPCDDMNVHIHPNNRIEVADIPNAVFRMPVKFPERLNISGLHRLKYFNVQGIHTQWLLASGLSLPDSVNLEQAHMGGSPIAKDNIMPASMLNKQRKLTLLNLSYSNLQGIEPDTFVHHEHLRVLDLSHNRLIASRLAPVDLSHTNLSHLNLSYNDLHTIPFAMRGHLDRMKGLQLDLSGNTFICNCDNLAFLQWIQRSASIHFHYAGNHVCADSPGNTIHNIEIDSLHCDWYWMQPTIAVCASLALTLFLAALVQLYKKRWHVSNFVFRLQERFSTATNENHPSTFHYDAFVLYSGVDDDRVWVHYRLRQQLEDVFGFRLCLHHRNFPAGVDIVDNIEKAIRSSRKVLVVMSENFLRSDWCLKEVQMTSSVDPGKFVVIMYKDVLFSGVHVPTEIRHLLETTTYIEWDEQVEAEKLFWKKLRRALYNKHQMEQRTPGENNRIILLNQI